MLQAFTGKELKEIATDENLRNTPLKLRFKHPTKKGMWLTGQLKEPVPVTEDAIGATKGVGIFDEAGKVLPELECQGGLLGRERESGVEGKSGRSGHQ